MAIVTFILVGLGIALIIIGTTVSLIDWNRRNKPKSAKGEVVVTEGTSLADTLSGLAKLADALKNHPLGVQLVFVGIVVLVIGGTFGGVAALK